MTSTLIVQSLTHSLLVTAPTLSLRVQYSLTPALSLSFSLTLSLSLSGSLGFRVAHKVWHFGDCSALCLHA